MELYHLFGEVLDQLYIQEACAYDKERSHDISCNEDGLGTPLNYKVVFTLLLKPQFCILTYNGIVFACKI
jgi:hypothetical protein